MDASDNCPAVPAWHRKLGTQQSVPICNKLTSIKIEQIPNFQEGNVLSEIWLKRIE